MAGTIAVSGLAGCTRPGAGATSDQSAAPQSSAQVSPPVSGPAEEPGAAGAAGASGVGDDGGVDAPGAGDAAVAASVQAVADAADALIAQAEEAMAGDG